MALVAGRNEDVARSYANAEFASVFDSARSGVLCLASLGQQLLSEIVDPAWAVAEIATSGSKSTAGRGGKATYNDHCAAYSLLYRVVHCSDTGAHAAIHRRDK